MDIILEAKNIFGGYGNRNVINGLNLRIRNKDFLGVIGPNGSGKTTLLRLLTRAIRPRKGIVLWEGRDIFKIGHKEFCQQVGFVPQGILTDLPFCVMDIVLMGRIPYLKRFQGYTKKDIEVAERSLELTGILHLKEKRIDELSLGEKQMVVISRALAQQTRLLFLDEPTSHLDIGHQIQILDLLKGLNRNQGLSVVLVLHDLNLASSYCDRLILLKDGQIFQEGSAQEVITYQNIEQVYRAVVVVDKNPINSQPYVFLVEKDSLRKGKDDQLGLFYED